MTRSGFSLLEVVLALAILAGAFAALGEVMRLGDRNAEVARDVARAEMLAESVMSEVIAGARPLANAAARFNLAADPPWTYSITVEPTEFAELVAVRVSVTQETTPELDPAQCDLVRWMANPDYLPVSGGTGASTVGGSTTGGQSATGGR